MFIVDFALPKCVMVVKKTYEALLVLSTGSMFVSSQLLQLSYLLPSSLIHFFAGFSGNCKQNKTLQDWLISWVRFYLLVSMLKLLCIKFAFVLLLVSLHVTDMSPKALIISSQPVFNFCRMEFDNPERPECTNLLSVYQLITGKSKQVFDANFTWKS